MDNIFMNPYPLAAPSSEGFINKHFQHFSDWGKEKEKQWLFQDRAQVGVKINKKFKKNSNWE